MITDKETNYLYLADTLPKRMPNFWKEFAKALQQHLISYSLLPNTKDIWAVDYMPIQVTKEKYVQFVYDPDYLKGSKYWQSTISKVDGICSHLGIRPKKSSIILDGGNVVRSQSTVIICNKVFQENPTIPERKLIKELEKLFEVDRIVFVPLDPYDEIGHADGMVRLVDDNTVLVNKYSGEDEDFGLSVCSALNNAGLKVIEVSYNPYENKTDLDARGIYMNYLQMEGVIFLPVFGMKEDEDAIKQFEQLFRSQSIVPLRSNDVAKEGGVINCITWNILQMN